MFEKENVLRILQETKQAVEKSDVIKLKELSNQTLHSASIEQDAESISVAVIVYSLSKIIERRQYQTYPNWSKFYSALVNSIQGCVVSLEKNAEEDFKRNLNLTTDIINKVSGKLKIYIQDVFIKAKINKASRIYEHGISMEKTAKLLGISMWDLANYAGQTGISDVPLGRTLDTKSRIKFAMEMFR